MKGSLNEKEINQFYDWVNETPENKQIFLRQRWSMTLACLKEVILIWIRAGSGYWKETETGAEENIHSLPKVQAYAAVAVIAVAFYFRSLWWLGDTSSVPVARYVGGDGIVADKVVFARRHRNQHG